MGSVKLRAYQKDGVNFLTQRQHAILGDEPGLGKTFTALEAAIRVSKQVHAIRIRSREAQPPVQATGVGYILVVCPPHLMEQWRDEILLYAPDMFVRLVNRHEPDSNDEGVYIISYNSIQTSGRLSLPWVWRTNWDAVIFDEAHKLRNRKSQQFKNAKGIKAVSSFFLTGSPMENNPSDIWALLHLCDRKRFSSYWRFVDYWMVVYEDAWNRSPVAVHDFLLPDFNKLTSEYMLRRLKTDELPELPNVVVDVRHVPIDPKLFAVYREAKDAYYIDHGNGADVEYLTSGAGLIQKLRQLISTPPEQYRNEKANYARELIDTLPKEQVIVFTWYRNSAEYLTRTGVLSPATGEDHRKTYLIDGDVPRQDRMKVIAEWRNDPTGILVGTLATIGEGMNLQTASTVIFYEVHYLPGSLDQAISRVQRMGQKSSTILAYVLLAKNTVDETVYRVSQKRHKNITAALLEDLYQTEGEG